MINKKPIPVAVRSKAWVFGRSLNRIVVHIYEYITGICIYNITYMAGSISINVTLTRVLVTIVAVQKQ
jgi:hypothetical protein